MAGTATRGFAWGARTGTRDPHVVRWNLFVWPPLAISFALLAFPQANFISMSLRRNLGYGIVSEDLTLINYIRIFSDPFYLYSLWLTVYLSLLATLIGLAFGLPTAYALARMRSRAVTHLIALLLVSSFVTVVIKVLGLSVVLSKDGLVNSFLLGLGLISEPIPLLYSNTGVVIGLIQYTLPLMVLVLYGVIQTIPPSLEDAAEVHGATRASVFRRVLLPLAKPGIIAGAMMSFNMSVGAFSTPILLGGGKVPTLPVIIHRKITQDVDYPFGSSLSTTLLLITFLINVLTAAFLVRERRAARRAG